MMKKILFVIILIGCFGCNYKSPYYRYTVEVHFSDGEIDTLVLPDAKTQHVGMSNGCIYTDRKTAAKACEVKYFKVVECEINYY